jgi:RNA polymerase sigma factor (sigma-70 family)
MPHALDVAPAHAALAALVARLAAGDADALAAFYESWFDHAYALARAITRRDESFCLDVVQDSFVRVIRGRHTLARIVDDDHLARWMSHVVHASALDALKIEARRVLRERVAGDAAVRRQRHGLADEIESIAHVLDSVSPSDRALLRLRFGSELTLRAAGEALGLTTFSAHARIRRLLRKLRDAQESAP